MITLLTEISGSYPAIALTVMLFLLTLAFFITKVRNDQLQLYYNQKSTLIKGVIKKTKLSSLVKIFITIISLRFSNHLCFFSMETCKLFTTL